MSERQSPSSFEFNNFHESRFQAIPKYDDVERIPKTIISQTDSLLGIYSNGTIWQPDLAREYLHDYTLEFLKSAEQGADRVFTKDQNVIDSLPLEANEAADYTYVIFAWMHQFATSKYLPNGFSRRGMLQAPATKRQFVQRTNEIKKELGLIVAGLGNKDLPLETRPSSLRAHSFFHVGNIIPFKFPETNEEYINYEKDKFNRLLGDTIIDL